MGINNLKSVNTPTEINKVTDTLMGKCNQILVLNPRVQLFLCPVLPTRDIAMNKKAMYMNKRMRMYIANSFNISMLDCENFVDQIGLLRNAFLFFFSLVFSFIFHFK